MIIIHLLRSSSTFPMSFVNSFLFFVNTYNRHKMVVVMVRWWWWGEARGAGVTSFLQENYGDKGRGDGGRREDKQKYIHGLCLKIYWNCSNFLQVFLPSEINTSKVLEHFKNSIKKNSWQKTSYLHVFSFSIFYFYLIVYCSGQDQANSRDRDTCPATWEVSQAVYSPNTSVDSYTPPRRESLPLRHLTIPRRGPRVPSNPQHSQLSDSSPTPIGHSSATGDSDPQHSCIVMVFLTF